MKIGILQTGKVNETLADRFGEYPPMFAELFRRVEPSLAFRNWAVVDGELPDRPDEADAWLITGSKFGVYDDEPWIAPLKDFLVRARKAGVPLIGICFGHQIMAEAFGGRAEKSHKGWGVGTHAYEVVRRPGWLSDAPDSFAMNAMHQDQVTALPDDAHVLAASPFCEYAMVAYGDAEAPDAVSIQPHPEFDRDYSEALVDLRADLLGDDLAGAARASFGPEPASEDFVRWVMAYLATTQAKRNAA